MAWLRAILRSGEARQLRESAGVTLEELGALIAKAQAHVMEVVQPEGCGRLGQRVFGGPQRVCWEIPVSDGLFRALAGSQGRFVSKAGSTSGNYFMRDWGIAVNTSGRFPISTVLGKPYMFYLQTLSTHEFGHVLGLGHPTPTGSCPTWNTNDAHAQLTMHACSAIGEHPSVSFAHYSLGRGDMDGAKAKSNPPPSPSSATAGIIKEEF